MYFNDSVPLEQEIYEADQWRIAEQHSKKRYKKLIREWIDEINPRPKGRLTESMIEAARQADISQLFPDARHGMVNCPFHNDKRPSASIKKGFFFCFVCGKTADPIKVKMDRDGYTFEQAVLSLV